MVGGFKPKKTKNFNIDKNSLLTIENVHSNMVKQIKKDEDNIPKLTEKLKLLKKKKNNCNNKKESIIFEKNIRDVKEEIKNTKCLKNNYYNNNLKYLFDYFEKKKYIK